MDLPCNSNGYTDRKAASTLLSFGQENKGSSISPLNNDSIRRENCREKTHVSCSTLHDKVLRKENVKPLLADRSQKEATSQLTLSHLQQDAETGRETACGQRQPLRDISPLAGGARTDFNSPVKRKAEPVDVLPSKKVSPDIRRDGQSAGSKDSTLGRGQLQDPESPEEITVPFKPKQPLGVSKRVARAIEFDLAGDHAWFVQHSDDEILPRLERLLEKTPKSSAEAASVFADEHQDWVSALKYHLYRKTGIEADTRAAIYRNLARLMAGWHRHHEAATLFMLLTGQLEHHPDHEKVMQSDTLHCHAFRHDCMNKLMTHWLHLNNQDHGIYFHAVQNNSDVREAVAEELGVSVPGCLASLAVNLRHSLKRSLERAMVDRVNLQVTDTENVPWRESGGFYNSMIMRLLRGAPHQHVEESINRAAEQGLLCECHGLPEPAK